MPKTINGSKYYRTAEVCSLAGISRSTFFRWLRESGFPDAANVDRREWRLFTEAEVARFREAANQVRPRQ